MPLNKPAIAAKPQPLTAKSVLGHKPIGIKVLPVPQKRPKPSDAERACEINNTADVASVKEQTDGSKIDVGGKNSDENRSSPPKVKNRLGIRVLPVPPKELHDKQAVPTNKKDEKAEEGNSNNAPQIQPRPTPRPRPVPQKRKSIIKKEFENVALDFSKTNEAHESKNKQLNRESVNIDGVTKTASSDSSHAPTFGTGETDDEIVRIRNKKTVENKEEMVVKRKSSFVPTRKAPPPPPIKPKAPKPGVKTSEMKMENVVKHTKSEKKKVNPNVHSPNPTNQTATNAKASSTAQSQLSSTKLQGGPKKSIEENEDSPLRPPRPNRLKKRLSCEGLLSDNLSDIAQNSMNNVQSSQESKTDKTNEQNKKEEDNVKSQTPGKINIKELAANLNVSAMKALKHQIDTKDKPRPIMKAKSEDITAENTEITTEPTKILVDSNDSLAVESTTNDVSKALQKELSDGTTSVEIENKQKSVLSIVGMGAQDTFSHSFSQSNNDLRQDSPSLVRKKNYQRSRSTEDLSTARGQRLSRSHTVECLFDDAGNDDDIYEVIPESPNSPLTPTAARSRTSRRLSRSSSVGQLLDLPPRNVINSRSGRPVFVTPPPPPYTPPESASPRFANFPLPSMVENSFQTSSTSDKRITHYPGKSPRTAHASHQPQQDIPDDDDDNVYEDPESMETVPVPEARKEVPPVLPRKESIRTPNNNKMAVLSTSTRSSPKRIPSREAPTTPIVRPATGRQESKSSIPSREAPSPLDGQALAPDVDDNIYDDEGYLAPTRMPIPSEGDYSYADMPDDLTSPVKSEPSLFRNDPVSHDDRQSITSIMSTDSHIYESIGSRDNTATADLKDNLPKDTTNRHSDTSSKGSSKDRESNISNVSRSVFYLEVDEGEKSKVERELSETDLKKISESDERKDEDDYEIQPEVEGYMGPTAGKSQGTGVGLDVEVPLPPRPARKKKPTNDATNQTETSADESEDDYIYPGDPDDDEQEKGVKDEKAKGSDDESYHYPADLSMEEEPESPVKLPVLPPRQKSGVPSEVRTPSGGSIITDKSPAPPPRSTSKSQSCSSGDIFSQFDFLYFVAHLYDLVII